MVELSLKVSFKYGPQSVSVYLEQSIWHEGQQISDWQARSDWVGDKYSFQQAINFPTFALGYWSTLPYQLKTQSSTKWQFWLDEEEGDL